MRDVLLAQSIPQIQSAQDAVAGVTEQSLMETAAQRSYGTKLILQVTANHNRFYFYKAIF